MVSFLLSVSWPCTDEFKILNDTGIKDEMTMPGLYESGFQDDYSDMSSLFSKDPVPRIYSDLGDFYQKDRLGDDESSLFVGSETRGRSATPLDVKSGNKQPPLNDLLDDWNGFSYDSPIEDNTDSDAVAGPPIKGSIEEVEEQEVDPEEIDVCLDSNFSDNPQLSSSSSPEPTLRKLAPIRVEMPESTLLVPKSHYEPFDPGLPIVSERYAVNTLTELVKSSCDPDDDFLEIALDDFAVYNDQSYYGVEMKSLHQLDTKQKSGQFYFDGVLSAGDQKLFVRRVPILALPIGNYGALDEHTVREDIWIQSVFNSRRDVYYKLGRPAKEYKRFFDPFLWVADLAKHFVDYLKSMGDDNQKVSIHHFKSHFVKWLRKAHGKIPCFIKWLAQHPSEDFRTAVIANLGFLHKEAIGVLGEKQTYTHIFWEEVSVFKRYKEPPKQLCGGENPPTIVTPYIMDLFQHMPFGDRLKVMSLSTNSAKLRNKLITKRHLELPHTLHDKVKHLSTAAQDRIRNIQPGDTISTTRDSEDTGTEWQREEARDFNDVDRWFALVQKVNISKRGKRSFDVIWYYRPVDTLCGLMKYPWNNEVFLSDHCSCGEDAKIEEDEVLGVHDVDFHGTSTTKAELFCRQTYIHCERKWISLKRHHMLCSHVQKLENKPQYLPGETVLVHLDQNSDVLQPCELISSEHNHRGIRTCKMRRLLRRPDVHPYKPKVAPNELVYSDQFVTASESTIFDRCHVRFFSPNARIPTPYDRDGVGSFFYITHRQVSNNSNEGVSLEPLKKETFPQSLIQAFDPTVKIPKLRGLDLFCGGGNFGRGLEDGGGVKMKWANDYDSKAIHTYMANVESVKDTHPFLGSIDILQRLAIEGKFSASVPKIGDVDFISAGSPCPGFSNLTNDKTTIQQRKNQSLVAAFASSVDLYRPKYGLLENVPGIVKRKKGRNEDVFSQLVCAIVGLGYQTQFYFLDASSCGSPQRRSRVFVVFAAPGFEMPRQPQQTHSHPPKTSELTIGRLPTGEPMAKRRMPIATPFKYVTAKEATADLPPILDAKPDICVPYPDHRVSVGQTKKVRMEMYYIPVRPYGMNFAKAWYGSVSKPLAGSGVLTKAEREFYPPETTSSISRTAPNSNAYGRQRPDRLIQTIVTRLSPNDAKAGTQMHWQETRVLSIMEARRAQGFRDEDVLLGNPSDQYKIVGNSVAREVAVALGIAFREAWVASMRKGEGNSTAAVATAMADEHMNALAAEPIIIDDLSDSDETDMDDTSRSVSRCSPSVTPPTSRSTSHREFSPMLNGNGKRPAQTFSVEIRASKTPRTGNDPLTSKVAKSTLSTRIVNESRGASRSTSIRPSPLGREVVMVDND